MRSKLMLIAAAGAALTLAACSQEHATEVKEGAQAAAADIKDAAHNIANDPDVKEAGTAIKESTKETAGELKEAAGEAADKAGELGAKAGQEAKEAGSELKHDVNKGAAESKKQLNEATN